MKFLATALLATLSTTSAFSLNMNMNGRSPLSHQYKSITSVHNSLMNGGGVRMAPPPGEPEPEVSFVDLIVCFII